MTNPHERIAEQLNKILIGENELPVWMTYSQPITCLPLDGENLLPDEQKGCKCKSRGTKDQLLIDKTVLKNCRKRHTHLAMA